MVENIHSIIGPSAAFGDHAMPEDEEIIDSHAQEEEPDQIEQTAVESAAEPYQDITGGKLSERRFGVRIDDEVEVTIMAGDQPRLVRGRVLKQKKYLELEDEEGRYHRIYYDWIVEIVLLKHHRPHPLADPELVEKSANEKRFTPHKGHDTAYH